MTDDNNGRRSGSCSETCRENAPYSGLVVCERFTWFASVPRDSSTLNRIHSIEGAFIFRVSEDGSQHALDVLQRRLGEVVFIGNRFQHATGTDGSELPQANRSNTPH